MASDAVLTQPALGAKATLKAVDANHPIVVPPDKDPPEDSKSRAQQLAPNSKTQISTLADQGGKAERSPHDNKSAVENPKMTSQNSPFEPEDENSAESTAVRCDSTANFVIDIDESDSATPKLVALEEEKAST